MNRRQVLEAAAVAERSALWSDFASLVSDGEWPLGHGFRVDAVVARIKLLSEAIGYPTPWPAIPVSMLKWYEVVETDGALGIYAEPIPWAEVSAHLEGVLEVGEDDIAAIRRIKPYQPDWSVDGAT